MKSNAGRGKCPAVKLAAVLLYVIMLCGWIRVSAFTAGAEDPAHLIDIYCSQTARDALGSEQLQTLVDLIVTSIEPQAVNLLIERFPCFREAAEKNELGREIGLYIYYKQGDQDGIREHEQADSGSYAYVTGSPEYDYDNDKGVYRYMIAVDAETLCETDDMNHPVLDLNGQARVQLDTTFCHELFHTFMYDYNRVGMTGLVDIVPFVYDPDQLLTDEEEEQLTEKTRLPFWFMEGLAGCVGNIYPADLLFFHEYHYDPDTQQYLDDCTNDQLFRMYTCWNRIADFEEQRYDLEESINYIDGGKADAAVYVSGYMACLYLADLQYRALEGVSAFDFDRNGEVVSISSEKLREGLSAILSRMHDGNTLDEVIWKISCSGRDGFEEVLKTLREKNRQ